MPVHMLLQHLNIAHMSVRALAMCAQAYMFKYDSVHGKYDGKIESIDGHLTIDGNKIDTYASM